MALLTRNQLVHLSKKVYFLSVFPYNTLHWIEYGII
ncbi:hypothetical protein AQAU111925_08355 [Aquirufa aurantiipilula]